MTSIVRALPVLYACQGCPEFGQIARDAGAWLDRQRLVELVWLNDRGLRPTQRFPIFSIDGCGKACAQRWLAGHGIAAQRSYVIGEHGPGAAERAAQHVAAELGLAG